MDLSWLAGTILLVFSVEFWQDVMEWPMDHSDYDYDKNFSELIEGERGDEVLDSNLFFQPGKYYRSKEGYLISNLSSHPKQLTNHEAVKGCDAPLLVSDLSSARKEKNLNVTEVDANTNCGI